MAFRGAPRNPYSFTLASFGRFRVLIVRPRNPYSFTLASFGRFGEPNGLA